jgi:transposase
MHIIDFTHMAKKQREPVQTKLRSLKEQGVLHPHPERVRDPAFQGAEFFDPHDRVQVKYEMVRRHQVDGEPVSEVAEAFGVSRQAFYQAETAFEAGGLMGLVPARPGPRRAHKCTPEILDFVERWTGAAGITLEEAIRERFGVKIHPRSLGRARERRKKKRAEEKKL